MAFSKSVLSNGIRVVTETHPYSRAASVGLWVETGTRDEKKSEAGLSHFLEHMVFKGTKSRSAYAIAKELDAVGGDLNAFTTQEYTCFHSTALKEDLKLQIEVLCDLITNATFDATETKRERGVVLQEIAMSVDNPEEHLFDIYFDKIYGSHSLGKPILGTAETVSSFTRADVLKFYNKRYTNKNIVVSCAGGVDHEKVVQLVEQYLGKMKRQYDSRKRTKPKFHPIREVITKEVEQLQLVVGLESCSFAAPERFDAFVVNSLLGGGMTSKLYQSIREKRGLAYTVYSSLSTFADTGVMYIYAGTEPKQLKTCLKLVMSEIEKVKTKKISESDLKLFKHQVKGSILLAADDIETRMNSLGANEMVFGDYRSVDKVVEDLEKVNSKSLKQYVEKYLDTKKIAIMVMGNVEPTQTQDIIEKY